MLFFVGSVHQIEICNGDNVDAESKIHFAMSRVAPPVRPTTLWHLVNTALAWRSPGCSKAGAWSITCPCDRKVCLLVCLLRLLAYSFVYDVDDEMGASRGREKHPCFYDASGGF